MITILWQISIMFILAFIGYLMHSCGKISEEGGRALGNILLFLSLPCVIFKSFLADRTPERVTAFVISTIAALLVLLMSMAISGILLRSNAIEAFSGAFSNPGFFGIPLIAASLSEKAVFYVAPFIAFLNLFQWTYGVGLLKRSDAYGNFERGGGRKEKSLGNAIASLFVKLVRAPFMVAIFAGSIFFFFALPLPLLLVKCVTYVADLNTPLAMFTVGIYLAQTDLAAMFKKKSLYCVSAIRLILIPAAVMSVLLLIPPSMYELKMAIFIASACPVGSNVAVYAQLYEKDYRYAVELVVVSTMLSIVTMPIMVGIGEMLLR